MEVLLILSFTLKLVLSNVRRDEQTLEKQTKVLEVPVVEGIYYLVYSDGQSQRWEANGENRRTLREKLRSQEVRKVLLKQMFL